MAGLEITGADKLDVLAKALKQYGDKGLEKELYSSINRSVKPLVTDVKRATPRYLPRRYALELAKSLRVTVTRRQGRVTGVRLIGTAKTPEGKKRDLASLNRGRLRHPLYGNRKHWYDQQVSPNWWDDPLIKGATKVRKEIVKSLDDVAKKLARKL